MENIRSCFVSFYRRGVLQAVFSSVLGLLVAILVLLTIGMPAGAFTTVTLSPTTPEAIETQFIADTTNQFQTNLIVNPFFPNTYQMVISGTNPDFNPEPTNMDLLNAIVTIDSYTYVYGWGDGESYQQFLDSNIAINFEINCSSPTYWSVPIDTTTCYAVTTMMQSAIYQEGLSTPTVVPGNF